MTQPPFVSIIVPVKNGAATVGKTLESLCALTYPHREIIVVNDGSTDATIAILERYAGRIKRLDTPGIGASGARNLALREARGEYVALTDADCIAAPGWLDYLLAVFPKDPGIAGVGGDQRSPADDTPFGKAVAGFLRALGFVIDYVRSAGSGFMFTEHNASCNVMYTRAVFDKVGFFSEGLWPGEDVDLDYRIRKAGFKLAYTPDAVVYHYRPGTIPRFMKMMFNYGRVQAILVRKYGFFRKIHAVPFVSAALLALIVLFAGRGTLLVPLTLTAGAFGYFYFVFKTRRPLDSIVFLCLAGTTVLCWNLGFCKGIVQTK